MQRFLTEIKSKEADPFSETSLEINVPEIVQSYVVRVRRHARCFLQEI